MEYLKEIPTFITEWLPALVTALVSIGLVTGARYVLLKRWSPPAGRGQMFRQLLITALAGILLVTFILALPIGDAARGQLLSLLGLLSLIHI